MKTKKIALLTSPGSIGKSIAEAAIKRGYKVTVIMDDEKGFNITDPNIVTIKGDVNRNKEVSRCVKNHDIVIYNQELKQNREGECFNATRSVIMGCKDAGIKRLIISGHINATGSDLSKTEQEAWASVQEEQFAALELLKREMEEIDWSYFYIMQTEAVKKGRRTATTGSPAISDKKYIKEYADSIIDEAENNQHVLFKIPTKLPY